MRAVVVGAGIGGLAAAAALEQGGHEVLVLERSDKGAKAGAGIAMGPNALLALERLGAAAHVLERGNTAAGRMILARSGRKLSEGPWKGGVVRRADLHEALRRRLHSVIAYGRRCIEVTQGGDGAVAHCDDGSVETGDLVIAADGLRSMIRAKLFGDGDPIYRGATSFRGIARHTHPIIADHIVETWGRGARIGLQNLGGGWTYWFTAWNAPEGSTVSAAEAKRLLQERFRGWHEPIDDVLAATDESEILQTDLYDRDPLAHWVLGRVALLGDAAHPMTPDLGQGGAQAIEDAVALGEALDGASDAVAGLREYELRRIPIAYDILRRARRHYRIAQLEGLIACSIRDATVPILPSALARALGVRRPKWVEAESSSAA